MLSLMNIKVSSNSEILWFCEIIISGALVDAPKHRMGRCVMTPLNIIRICSLYVEKRVTIS